MKILPGERVLFESKSEKLVLTTHRIRFESRTLGKRRVTSFMLEEIASCDLISRIHPSFLVVAVIFGAGGFYLVRYVDFAWAIGLAFTALSLIAFLATIERILLVSSSGSVISVPLAELGEDDPTLFIDDLEVAKNTRYLSTRVVQQAQAQPKTESLDTRREPTLARTNFRNLEGGS